MIIPCPICAADSTIIRARVRSSHCRCANGHKFPRPEGALCECGNPRSTRSEACDRCAAIESARAKEDMPRQRILAYFARVEWVGFFEAMEAMDVPHVDCPERWRWSAAIARLVEDGLVEWRHTKKWGREYRLVQAVRSGRRAA